MQRLATQIILVLLLVQLILLVVSIPGHPLHIDEAWIGEQTYFLERDGYVHSNLFEGLAGHDQRSVVYHRLFVTAGSWAVGGFGWGIAQLRVVPALATLGLLVAMALYMRLERKADLAAMTLPLVIFLFIPIAFYHAKIYRPEMMMTLFGFTSYWLLERGVNRERGLAAIAFGGLLAGAAALTHLYGLIFVVAGAYMLARTKHYAAIGIFIICAALPFIPYLHDIATHRALFDAQISNPIAAKKTSFTLLTPFANLLEEHKRLFRKPEIIVVMLLFIIPLIPAWRAASAAGDRRRRILFEYTIALIVLLGMVSGDKLVTRYAIPLFPFLAIAISSAIVERPGLIGGNRPYRALFAVTLALFTLYGMGYQVYDTFSTRERTAEINGMIGERLPDGARVVAPMNMIFDQIGRLHIIGLYLASKEQHDTLTFDSAIAFAKAHRADYIVTNSMMTDEERIINLGGKAEFTGKEYLPMESTDLYQILERAGGVKGSE